MRTSKPTLMVLVRSYDHHSHHHTTHSQRSSSSWPSAAISPPCHCLEKSPLGMCVGPSATNLCLLQAAQDHMRSCDSHCMHSHRVRIEASATLSSARARRLIPQRWQRGRCRARTTAPGRIHVAAPPLGSDYSSIPIGPSSASRWGQRPRSMSSTRCPAQTSVWATRAPPNPEPMITVS